MGGLRSSVTYSKELRQHAKDKGGSLVTISTPWLELQASVDADEMAHWDKFMNEYAARLTAKRKLAKAIETDETKGVV